MNITQCLVIQEEHDNPLYKGKPYFLFIPQYGAVGDRLNCDAGATGVHFPPSAAERMEKLSEALEIYDKFILYVNDKIKQGRKMSKEKRRPSYCLWT